MTTILIIIVIILLLLVLLLQVLFRYKPDLTRTIDFASRFESLLDAQQRSDNILRQELAQTRTDSATIAREGREELTRTFVSIGESLLQRLAENADLQQSSLKSFNDLVLTGMGEIAKLQKDQLETFSENINKLTVSIEAKLEALREIVEAKLRLIQEDNAKQLEQMRSTVDEKLQGTLEKRLGESFKQVSERLEQVHKGLGEMQSLASGVGDLKRVLTNVKTRGGWGEVQLGAILEQMLTPDQYDMNVKTKEDSDEIVEYAIRLPGQDLDKMDVVWLPVDSKFPIEDYQRLVDAQERVDSTSVIEASRALRTRVITCAKEISLKYLHPPNTTDFGIMFLPTEGLFAEVIRQPGLIEELQQNYRVAVAGPTTFAALLNSLQMGFKTLKIQKQSSEVWNLLSAVKTEFSRFGSSIDAVKKKLLEASNKIDDVDVRTRAVQRKLRKVEELPSLEKASNILEIAEPFDDDKDA